MEPSVQAGTQVGAGVVTRPIGVGVLVALALLAGTGPLGIDLYLPAFPAMTAALSTTASGVQLSLTAFLVGAGVGQVIFGPWSDRSGRMGPLLAGLVLFLVAGLATVFAGSVEMLVVARLFQGLGGAAGMVISRAVIRDRASGTAAARAQSVMMAIVGISPVAAPLVGGVLAEAIGWRGLLSIVTGLGAVALVATLLFVRESLPRHVRQAHAAAEERGVWRALLSRGYVGHVIAAGFGLAIMMSFISASPFVYQHMIGLSSAAYGLAFAVNAIGLTAATALSARLTHWVPLQTLAAVGLGTSLVAVVVLLSLILIGVPTGWLTVPLFFAIAPLGLAFGNVTALALAAVPHSATGAASALLGMLQFLLAGVVAGLVGVAGEDTTLPLALTMLAAAVVALIGLATARTGQRHDMSTPPLGAA